MSKDNSAFFTYLLPPDDWQLMCKCTDTLLIITVFKLDSKTRFVKRFESIPQRFQILAESLTELSTLLLTSKGVKFIKNTLVIACQVGNKIKNVELPLEQQQIPLQQQLDNLRKLLEIKNKNQIEAQQQYKNTVNKLQNQNMAQKKRIDQLEKQLENKTKELFDLDKELEKDYVNCTKWGCQVLIAKKNQKHHKAGRSGIICDEGCSY